MRFVLNLIWFVLAGIWMAVAYAFAALICFILIITIPFGMAAPRIADFALWPFERPSSGAPTPPLGREIVSVDDAAAFDGR